MSTPGPTKTPSRKDKSVKIQQQQQYGLTSKDKMEALNDFDDEVEDRTAFFQRSLDQLLITFQNRQETSLLSLPKEVKKMKMKDINKMWGGDWKDTIEKIKLAEAEGMEARKKEKALAAAAEKAGEEGGGDGVGAGHDERMEEHKRMDEQRKRKREDLFTASSANSPEAGPSTRKIKTMHVPLSNRKTPKRHPGSLSVTRVSGNGSPLTIKRNNVIRPSPLSFSPSKESKQSQLPAPTRSTFNPSLPLLIPRSTPSRNLSASYTNKNLNGLGGGGIFGGQTPRPSATPRLPRPNEQVLSVNGSPIVVESSDGSESEGAGSRGGLGSDSENELPDVEEFERQIVSKASSARLVTGFGGNSGMGFRPLALGGDEERPSKSKSKRLSIIRKRPSFSQLPPTNTTTTTTSSSSSSNPTTTSASTTPISPAAYRDPHFIYVDLPDGHELQLDPRETPEGMEARMIEAGLGKTKLAEVKREVAKRMQARAAEMAAAADRWKF